ncbi:MAG: aminotransferase class V-fold PLP-dependent enzyme [Candidatus Kapaibacteriales bacterium]
MFIKRRKLMKIMGLFPLLTPFKVYSKEHYTKLYSLLSSFGRDDLNNSDFWSLINQSFTISKTILNLNNGGVSPQPKIVQDTFEYYNRLANEGPAYFMWRILDQGREPLRQRLSIFAGCSPEEIAINRNTTEGMNTIIFGLKLNRGDEVVLAKQDYPNVINAWKFREARDGIKLVWVNLELPSANKNYLIDSYTSAFTSKTKVVNITHMINWNGQILPIRDIAEEAHKKGIFVLVDAAHTFAHIDFKISDLNCDFLATSLHKWLCGPFGTGMLYVRKENIKNITPLFPNDDPKSDNIRKFESLGTRSFPAEMAIGEALTFTENIGMQRKEFRLRYLKDYWVNQCREIPRVEILTADEKEFSCGIGLFAIKGKKPEEISDWLFKEKKIFTTAINWENIHGVRITPHLFTREIDLDYFCEAVKDFVKQG